MNNATLLPAPYGDWQTLRDLGAYDVVVVGGGAAGSAAAICAGRMGLTVLLVESLSFLGGTGVAAQVTPWMGNHIDMGPLNEGLSAELQRDLEAMGQASGYYINPEALKSVLERKAIDAGVTLLFEAMAVAVHGESGKQSNRVDGLIIATRGGLSRASARTAIIDATGDAHVAHLAGVRCREGRESDQMHQPMSLRFVLGRIDHAKVKAFLRSLGEGMIYEQNDGAFANGQITGHFLTLATQQAWPQKWLDTFSIQFFGVTGRPGELWFNCPRLTGFDPLDPLSLSRAYVEGRRLIDAYLKLFREEVPGAEQAYLVMIAPLMGIREGRRIVGKYVLTGEDFVSRRKFDDGICLNRYPVDIHNPTGRGLAQWTELPEGEWHEIPFRCLVPETVRGLLVAGRCISGDFTAQASYRIIPNCRTMGEAAGLACAMARENGIDVADVDGCVLRSRMLSAGYLPAWAKSVAPSSRSEISLTKP